MKSNGFAWTVLALTTVVLSGCTGTRVAVSPSPDSLPGAVPQKFASVGVKAITADKIYPPAGNLVPDFVQEIETSGLAKAVYCPVRPDDKVDAMLETKINVTMNPHMGPNMVKAVLTGFTLFVLEPVFWYHYSYALSGDVVVVKDGKRTSIGAQSDGTISMKWLSLSHAQSLEAESIKKAKQSLFRQLIQKLSQP